MTEPRALLQDFLHRSAEALNAVLPDGYAAAACGDWLVAAGPGVLDGYEAGAGLDSATPETLAARLYQAMTSIQEAVIRGTKMPWPVEPSGARPGEPGSGTVSLPNPYTEVDGDVIRAVYGYRRVSDLERPIKENGLDLILVVPPIHLP